MNEEDYSIITNRTDIIPRPYLPSKTLDIKPTSILKWAVKAFKSSPNNIGIAIRHALCDAELSIAIHSKNGTGVSTYQFPLDYSIHDEALRKIVSVEISEYRGIELPTVLVKELKKFKTFQAVSDPILTDLVYGNAVMHTNIDDRTILFKDFALFSIPFSKQKYESAKQILGYTPIIEFSAINKRGVEMDFITLNSRLLKYKDYGYFVMKTPVFKEKAEILRKRFTSGMITFIVSDAEFKSQEVDAYMHWFRNNNINFIKL